MTPLPEPKHCSWHEQFSDFGWKFILVLQRALWRDAVLVHVQQNERPSENDIQLMKQICLRRFWRRMGGI